MIQKFDPNKAHGHGNISTCMLKICGSSIYKPIELKIKQFIETGVFPSEWKKDNIVFIHKKGDKTKKKNAKKLSSSIVVTYLWKIF